LILSTLFSICTFSADTPTQQLLITFKAKSLKVSNIEEIHSVKSLERELPKRKSTGKTKDVLFMGKWNSQLVHTNNKQLVKIPPNV
jgi:hypothetical protein